MDWLHLMVCSAVAESFVGLCHQGSRQQAKIKVDWFIEKEKPVETFKHQVK